MNNKAFQSVFRTIGGAEKDVVPREQCSLIGNKRHHYDEDFKRQAVRQLIESGKPVTAIAQSIGVERTILQKWRKKFSYEFVKDPNDACGEVVGIKEFIKLKREFESIKETLELLRNAVKKSLASKYLDDI